MAKYSADRVRNVSTVWLAATVGCAECHDHKFDPYKTREFYSLAAFFADVKETAVGVQEPTRFPSPAQAEALERVDREAGRVARRSSNRPKPSATSWPSSKSSRKRCSSRFPARSSRRRSSLGRSAFCRGATGSTKPGPWCYPLCQPSCLRWR